MNEKRTLNLIYLVSGIVFLVVLILFLLPKAYVVPPFVKYLPLLNAFLNGTCACLLVVSLYCILNKRISLHKKLNITAFVLSSLFLVSYILFHSYGIETKFPADNPIRPVYLFILLTHILLAAIVLPLVLISFYYGLTNQFIKHKKITRFSFPIWLYVTITGVVVYIMIAPYYKF
jgi:putative membrane protein